MKANLSILMSLQCLIHARSFLLTAFLQTLLTVLAEDKHNLENSFAPWVKSISDLHVELGKSAVVACQMRGPPQPIIQWLRSSIQGETELPGNDTRISVSSSGTLTIQNVTVDDEGTYLCVGTNPFGSMSAPAKIAILVAPSFVEPPLDVTEVVGNSVSLRCRATGSPTPAVFWSRNTGPIDHLIFPSQDHGRFTVDKNGTLKIVSVRHEDAGTYRCQAVNLHGTAAITAAINVTDPPSPPVFISGPINMNVSTGSIVTFPCEVTGVPKPSVTWYYKGSPISVDETRVNITEESELQIADIRLEDAGKYSCKAQNSEGKNTRSAALSVYVKDIREPPIIQTEPEDQDVAAGSLVQMACPATGVPQPITRWFHDDRPIVLTDSRINVTVQGVLELSDVRVADSGVYTCKVTNTIGEATRTAMLTVTVNTCPCLMAPHNGRVTIFGVQPGNIARFNCDPKFSLIGSEYVRCEISGQWSNSPPVCRDGLYAAGIPFATCAISMPDEYTVLYRNYQLLPSNTSSRFPHGTELQARCRHIGKYTFHGSSHLACMHGQWTGDLPYCTPNGQNKGNFTPEIDFRVDVGQYLITPDGRLAVRPGSKVVFTCHYNNTDDWFLYWINEHRNSYPTRETDDTTLELTLENIQPSDAGEFSCLNLDKVGRTSIVITVEDWTCPQSDITSQNLLLMEEDNQLGGRAVFRCAEGYTMEGSGTSVCQIGGKWYPPSPVCKGKVCPCFDVPPHIVSTTQRNDRSYSAYFSCLPGYRLNGTTDVSCTANGTWSHPIPTCVEIDCGPPPGFNEGRLVGNRTTLGGIFYFWCESGVIPPGGTYFTKCQADGKWSHDPPSCLEIRCNQSETDCFTLNCSSSKQYLVPRDQNHRRWGCCGNTLYNMQTSVCEMGGKTLPCSDGYPCSNGNCVPHSAVCDGHNDCSDGTDEKGCDPCDGTQFRCRDGQCIHSDHVCDRSKDCHDGTDETGCSRGLAPIGEGQLGWCDREEFTCPGDRVCLPLSKVCDGHYDCDGGYDEEQCGIIHCNPRVETCRTVSCPGGELAFIPFRTRYVEWGCCRKTLYSRRIQFCSTHGVYLCPDISFRCHNGNCVPPRWRCDSENDCSDGTDEAGCHGCPPEEYNCGDGQCVHQGRVCDKVKDCFNGMDEVHCARSDGQWCGGKHYRCANDKCILRENVCNLKDDCGDGSDEVKCFPDER